MSPPLAGAWIEIESLPDTAHPHRRRPPSRGRGLKSKSGAETDGRSVSPPLAGAWIEILLHAENMACRQSPPLAGAWIEIMLGSSLFIFQAVAPPRGGVD